MLGLPGQRQAPLLPYLWLPALLASAFATPTQVMALDLMALGCSIATIVRGLSGDIENWSGTLHH